MGGSGKASEARPPGPTWVLCDLDLLRWWPEPTSGWAVVST